MDLVEDLAEPDVPVVAACAALGVSRATLYRGTRPAPPPTVRAARAQPSPAERRRAASHRRRHAQRRSSSTSRRWRSSRRCSAAASTSRPSARSTACSPSSERRRSAEISGSRTPYAKPSLTATAPNQVWTWDITKLATLQKGVFLHAYVIIDLFSRYVVGWMVAAKECKHLAAQLFAETVARHGIEPGLTVHADRGSAMKSDTLAQLLATLGVDRSFSRPRVSDDNPFSESQFKTLKYQPDYPGRFAGVLHARGWLAAVLRLAQRRPSPLRPRALHARRRLLRPRRRRARRAAGRARRRVRRSPRALPQRRAKAALPPAEVHINPLEAMRSP